MRCPDSKQQLQRCRPPQRFAGHTHAARRQVQAYCRLQPRRQTGRVETRDASGGNTYGSVGSVKVTLVTEQWVDVVMDFSVPADHQSVTSIVFHNDDQIPGLVFYLDEVKLEILAKPAPVEEKEITRLLNFSFNDKQSEESLFTVASSSKIEWVRGAGIGKDDDTALKVTHIDGKSHTSAENAVRLTLKIRCLPQVYNISVWFYARLL